MLINVKPRENTSQRDSEFEINFWAQLAYSLPPPPPPVLSEPRAVAILQIDWKSYFPLSQECVLRDVLIQ